MPDPAFVPPSQYGSPRRVLVAVLTQVAASLPVMLVGATAVHLRRDLGIGPTILGVATGVFVLSTAATSVHLGRLTDRVGALRGLRIACTISVLASGGIAALAHHWLLLIGLLAIGGSSVGIAHAASNRLLSRTVSPRRLGTAFGIKQSGPAVATVLAGLAIPAVANTVGWRWAFAGGSALAVVAVAAIPTPRMTPTPRAPTATILDVEGVALKGLATGLGFFAAAMTSLNAFLVTSAVHAGIPDNLAGLLLAAAGIIAVLVRVGMGLLADRREADQLRRVVGLLVIGAAGYALVSVGQPRVVVLGTAIAAAGALGMTGLFFLALVQRNHEATGGATGRVLAGASFGGLLGPPIFGFTVETYGHHVAWLMAAVWLLIAAGVIEHARRQREYGHDRR